MPKFQENTGFKLPGVGSKEIDTPGVFRKDQGVEDVGYCSNTEPHMLPKGSSPLLKSMIDQVVPEYYRTSYTRTSWPVKKAPTEETKTADPSDNKVKVDNKIKTEPIKTEPLKAQTFKEFMKTDKAIQVPDLVSQSKPRESITINTRGKSMRQAYDDALKLGFRTADESFEDYSARARKDPNYGKGGGSFTISGRDLIDSRNKKKK
tara:strand:- start:1821 stop:2438 length:618 start_codon:yes stop_codon:yes gene_type:complete